MEDFVDELEGGAYAEGQGVHGRPLKFYVVASARAPREVLSEAANSPTSPDLLSTVPLARDVVESLLRDICVPQPVEGNEEEDVCVVNARGEMMINIQRLEAAWRHYATSDMGLETYRGMERTNTRINGSGTYRWEVRRQRLMEMPQDKLDDVAKLTRAKAISRLRSLWCMIQHLYSTTQLATFAPEAAQRIESYLQDHEGNVLDETSFASLPDEIFDIGVWCYKADEEYFHIAPVISDAYIQRIQTESLELKHQQEHIDACLEGKYLVGWKELVKECITNQSCMLARTVYGFGFSPLSNVFATTVIPTESRHCTLSPALGTKYQMCTDHYCIEQRAQEEIGYPLKQNASSCWTRMMDTYYGQWYKGFWKKTTNDHPYLRLLVETMHADDPSVANQKLWSQIIQGYCVKKLGCYLVPLKTYLKAMLPREEEILRLKHTLRNLWTSYNVLDTEIDEMFDVSTEFYDSLYGKIYIALEGPVGGEAGGEIRGAIWCQSWKDSPDGKVLSVSPTRRAVQDGKDPMRTQPWHNETENGSSDEDIEEDMNEFSLFVRANGSTKSKTKLRHWMVLYVLTLLASEQYVGVIMRLPQLSVGAAGYRPDLPLMAEYAQVFGMQRVETVLKVQNQYYFDATVPQAVRTRSLLPFQFEKTAPWSLKRRHNTTQESWNRRKQLASSHTIADFSGLTFTAWNTTPIQTQQLQSHYMASVYPTCSQLFTSACIMSKFLYRALEDEEEGAVAGAVAGAAEVEGNAGLEGGLEQQEPTQQQQMTFEGGGPEEPTTLQGGEQQQQTLEGGGHLVQEWGDDDGQLTALERTSRQISEDLAWYGSSPSMT